MNPPNHESKGLTNEQKILAAVDSLAQLLLDLYNIHPALEPDQDTLNHPKLNEAFRSLNPLLLPLINQRAELLPQMICQLFLQKIPYSPAPNFSRFYASTVQALSQCLAPAPLECNLYRSVEAPLTILDDTMFHAQSQEEYLTLSNNFSDSPSSEAASLKNPSPNALADLLRILRWCYPQQVLYEHWHFRSFTFDIYLPKQGLVFQLSTFPMSTHSPDSYGFSSMPSCNRLWLRKKKLRILRINENLLGHPSQVKKFLSQKGCL